MRGAGHYFELHVSRHAPHGCTIKLDNRRVVTAHDQKVEPWNSSHARRVRPWQVDFMATPSLEWLQGTRAIHVHDEVELLWQSCRKAVAHALRFWPIDRSDRTLRTRSGRCRRDSRRGQRSDEGSQTDVVKQALVATPRTAGRTVRKAAGSSHS